MGEPTPTIKPMKPSNEYVLNFAFYSFVGFVLFQAGFAIVANSQSMMADCQAMAVDAMTYLFNLCAERIKNSPFSENELGMSATKRTLRRERQRLWLELIPPAISVSCLISIVIMTFNESLRTLFEMGSAEDDDVSVPIMLIFSGANLLLDMLNVYCFARSGLNFGLQTVRDEHKEIQDSLHSLRVGEGTSLIQLSESEDSETDLEDMDNGNEQTHYGSAEASPRKPKSKVANLNMCSAWTHVCADTMRSISVLVAAAIATIFPVVPGDVSDSSAALAVSLIILISLVPLLQGLIITAIHLYELNRDYGDMMH